MEKKEKIKFVFKQKKSLRYHIVSTVIIITKIDIIVRYFFVTP
jgi:hypothetical protein